MCYNSPMTEAQEGKGKILEEQNRLIAKRINGILSKSLDLRKDSGEAEDMLDFSDPNDLQNPIVSLCAVIEKKEGWEDQLFVTVPDGLTFPVYAFMLSPHAQSNRAELRATTKYGWMPIKVIGLDNKYYEINNIFFLDSNGKAVKVEHIWCLQQEDETLESVFDEYEFSEEEKQQIKRLDFVPGEEERTVKLGGGDYENILYYLDKIEAGEYK